MEDESVKATSRREQLARLFRVILELQGGRMRSARELAEVCGVSRRTLYRDLRTLESAGVPIAYRPDRLGYQLAPTFGLAPPELEEREALALVVVVRRAPAEDGLDLRREACSGLEKVIHALPPEVRARAMALGESIGGRDDLPAGPPPDRPAAETILEALIGRRQVRICYRAEDGRSEGSTKLSPYRLLSTGRSWVVVGRSSLHRGVRSFPLADIRSADLTEDAFEPPPRFAARRRPPPAGPDLDRPAP